MRTIEQDIAFEETNRYIHKNPVLSFITNRGYRACNGLIQNKESVLDVGCGTGDFIPYLNCKHYTGLDIHENFITIARERFPHYEFVLGDVYSLPFNDSTIPSIVSFGLLEHLKDIDKGINEIRRVLAADGEFIFGIPTEGFIYRMGRNFTTKPHVEQATGTDYDNLLKIEHVNSCKDVLQGLKINFIINKISGVPFKLPFVSCNVFIVGRCVKNEKSL